jgi:hypothetical protein
MRVFAFAFSLVCLLLLCSCAVNPLKNYQLQTNQLDSDMQDKLLQVDELLDKVEDYLEQGPDKEWYYQMYMKDADDLFNEIKSDPTYGRIKYNKEVVSVRTRLRKIKERVASAPKGLSPVAKAYLKAVNKNLDTLEGYADNKSWKAKREWNYLQTNWKKLENTEGFDENQPQIAESKARIIELQAIFEDDDSLPEPIVNNLKTISDYLYKSDKYLTQGILWKAKNEFKYAETFWNKTKKLEGFDMTNPEILKVNRQLEELKGDIEFEENM